MQTRIACNMKLKPYCVGLYYTYPKDRDRAASKALMQDGASLQNSRLAEDAQNEQQYLLRNGREPPSQIEISPLQHENFAVR